MSPVLTLGRRVVREYLGIFFVCSSVLLARGGHAQALHDSCAQFFTHDPAEPFVERSVINHDEFLQAEHFRTALLLMRDNPELIPRYSEPLAKRQLDTEARLRRQVNSIEQYPPADPLFNHAHPAFALEYSNMLKDQPALAAGPALDIYLREDAEWTFLQQIPGWSRNAPDAWVGMFLFPRSLEVDRDLQYAAREAAPILEKQLQLASRRESPKLWYPVDIGPSDYAYDPATRQLTIKPDLLGPAAVQPPSLIAHKGAASMSLYKLPDIGTGSGVAEDSVHIPGDFRTTLSELSTWRGMVEFQAKPMAAALDRQLHLPALTLSASAISTARLDHPDTLLRLRLFLEVQHALPSAGSSTEFVFLARVEKVDVVDEKGSVIASVAGQSLPAATGVPGSAPRAWRPAAFSGGRRTEGLNCRNIQASLEQSKREGDAETIARHAANKTAEAKRQACNEQAAHQADLAGPSPGPEWQAALKSAREACLLNGPSKIVAARTEPPILSTAQTFTPAPGPSGNSGSVQRSAPDGSGATPAITPTKPAAIAPPSMSAQERTARMMQQVQAIQQQEIERLKRGIVRVVSQMDDQKEVGAGFVISSTSHSALIATALHVVQGARSVTVFFYGDQARPVAAQKLSKHSSTLDLALLEVAFPPNSPVPASLPKYNFAANNTLYSPEQIFTVNGDGVIVPNTITRLSHEDDPQRFEYSNVSVGPGFSGGPVLDAYHDIIGMHTSRDADRSFAVAIKIDSALQVLEALGYSVPHAGPVVMPDYAAYSQLATPKTAETAAPSVIPERGSGPVTPQQACADGCKATLGSLRHVAQYKTANQPRSCTEEVRAFPKGWPDDNFYLHINACPSVQGGTPSVTIYLAQTEKQGDRDPRLGIANLLGSSGQGVMNDLQGNHWRLVLQNATYGSALDLNAISISIARYGLRR